MPHTHHSERNTKTMTEAETYLRELSGLDIQRVVFSLPLSDNAYRKTVLRVLENGSYQAESFTEKQAFHENFPAAELESRLTALFPAKYRQMHAVTTRYEYDAKLSKKGKLLTNRTKVQTVSEVPAAHNRAKNYLIDAENLPPVFQELGVAGADGKILRAKYDKYRQICRFTELIDDVLAKDSRDELRIVDFGCVKSYLTFVIYYYITEILRKKAYIVGLDLKKEVIDKCRALAVKYGYTGLDFRHTDIKDFVPDGRVDMVIALHACDTATDYALYFAVKTGANYIFAVPCCQKEVNQRIKAQSLTLLTDYGLVKERFSALVTDALRAKLLEVYGYAAEIVEFVDFENSPKNMLIRARRKASADRFKRERCLSEIEKAKKEFGIEITLERLLAEL